MSKISETHDIKGQHIIEIAKIFYESSKNVRRFEEYYKKKYGEYPKDGTYLDLSKKACSDNCRQVK